MNEYMVNIFERRVERGGYLNLSEGGRGSISEGK